MWTIPTFALVLLTAVNGANTYGVPFRYGDRSTQACSGMWAGRDTFINVTLDRKYSAGQLEMLIYEAADEQYVGRPHRSTMSSKTYFCNPWNIKGGVCVEEERGHFLFNLPSGMSLSNTSIRTTRLVFPNAKHHSFSASRGSQLAVQDQALYSQPKQNHVVAPHAEEASDDRRTPLAGSEVEYIYPVHYPVQKTGYYCVAYRPVLPAPPYKHPIIHSVYKGTVLFHNGFAGNLPAADYAKLVFYAVTFSLYSLFAIIWGALYWHNRKDTQLIHTSLSAILGLATLYTLLMLAHFAIVNSKKRGHPSSILHLVAHVVRAAYYTLTLAALLTIGHGITFVGGDRSLGRLTIFCACCLSILHFIFGTLYAYAMILGLEYPVKEVVLEKLGKVLVPLEVITVIFVVWFMLAWIATLKRMSPRTFRLVRQKVIFTGCTFVLALTIYLALHVYFLYRSLNDTDYQRIAADEWRHLWLTDGPAAGWREMVYMPAFLVTLYIWRPCDEKFAYEGLSQSEGEVETERGVQGG